MESLAGKEIDKIIGKRFKFRGRGPEEFDCLGAVIYLTDKIFGIKLVDPFDSKLQGSILNRIAKFRAQYTPIDPKRKLECGDVLYHQRKTNKFEHHVVFVENKRWGVMVGEETGVCRLQLSRIRKNKNICSYRLKSQW